MFLQSLKCFLTFNILLIIGFLNPIALAEDSQSETVHNTETTHAAFPAGLYSLGKQSQVAFVVDKTRRFLRVYDFDNNQPRLLLEVPSDIGKKSGDKTQENDHKTPTGIYFLQKKLAPPEIPFKLYGDQAFTTDYPNIFDKRSSKTGSGIWLHAVPDTVPLTRGSRGCVVVRNEIIKQLRPYVTLGETPLIIFDEVQDVSLTEYSDEQKKFLGFFAQWKKAWESQDVDSYMQFYDESFKNDQMNFKQWYAHKKKLKALYKYIKVQVSDPLLIRNKDQIVIRTYQEYESDLHKDSGIKTIHAKYLPDQGFKIIREDWKPAKKLSLSNPNQDITQLLKVNSNNPTVTNIRNPASTEQTN